MQGALRQFPWPQYSQGPLDQGWGQQLAFLHRFAERPEKVVQTHKGPWGKDLERNKESVPAALREAKEEKGEQEQDRVWDNPWAPEIERPLILDKKAASIGCKKSSVIKNQRLQGYPKHPVNYEKFSEHAHHPLHRPFPPKNRPQTHHAHSLETPEQFHSVPGNLASNTWEEQLLSELVSQLHRP